MRVYRNVCTYIWNDDKFPFASDDVQLLWFHIFTNPLSSPLGVFRATIGGLAEDKNRNGQWPELRYRQAFADAIGLGLIDYDPRALLIAFPKFFSPTQTPNHPISPNQLKSWGERFNDLPSSPLKDNCYQALKAILLGKAHGMLDAFLDAFVMPSGMASPIPDPNPNPNPDPNPEPKKDMTPHNNYREDAKLVLNFLNEKAGKKFRAVDVNLSMIELRLKSGVDAQTCKTMIMRKVRDWKDDEKMARFLRPETLFNKTKFETYIAEVMK